MAEQGAQKAGEGRQVRQGRQSTDRPDRFAAPGWTGARALREQVQKLWDRGLLLAEAAGAESPFPVKLRCRGPKSRELAEHFPEVWAWIAELQALEEEGLRLEWHTVHDRVLGSNELPCAVWLDERDCGLRLLGKTRQAERFRTLVECTRSRHQALLPWLQRKPLQALELAELWPAFLDILDWMLAHPRPGIYLREMDVPGVHTKLIEQHKGLLSEFFECVLPGEQVDETARGAVGFCRRFGFRDKPARVRFRLLDAGLAGHFCGSRDVTIPGEDFARLQLPLARVFVTENEINFLSFPDVPASLVIFGAGYGFENLAAVPWLATLPVFYWGDLDTHGFAILHQLRALLPQTVSLLMDKATLLHHKSLWVREPEQKKAQLPLLTCAEAEVYEGLCSNRWGTQVRLEQERIGFGHVCRALQELA